MLDSSFANNGAIQLETLRGRLVTSAQSDADKIAVVEFGGNGETLTLLNADGTLDSGFGSNGVVDLISQFEIATGRVFADLSPFRTTEIAFDSQGRILVVASVTPSLEEPAFTSLLRLNTDGSIDNTFGLSGHNFQAGRGRIDRISIGPNGEIAFAGLFDNSTTVWSYDSNGNVNNSFGVNSGVGISPEALPPSPFGGPSLFSFFDHTADGSLVFLTGSSSSFTDVAAALVKLAPDGQLDQSFGSGGTAFIPDADFNDPSTAEENYTTAVIDDQGRIVVGGSRSFLRYSSDGQLDSSFGVNGQLVTPENVFDNGLILRDGITEMVIDNQGRIVVLSSTLSNFFVRIDDTGNFDTTLSDDGIQLPDHFTDLIQFADIGIDSASRIITIGSDNSIIFSGNVFVSRYVIEQS